MFRIFNKDYCFSRILIRSTFIKYISTETQNIKNIVGKENLMNEINNYFPCLLIFYQK